jgi:hypothetical protein
MTGERAGPAWLWSDELIPDPLGRADKAVRFLKKLRLHEGRFAGQKFPLQDWQERLIRKIYGPVDDLGRRQNTKAGSSPYCLPLA